MVLSAPWYDSYLNDCKGSPNFDHWNLPPKPLYYLDWKLVSEKQTPITIYIQIRRFSVVDDYK